ncbi:ABC transporter permease [Bordetella parapertussis]|uniref:Inner membrane component of ABC transporter n=1 Tax=Bordetella parapertussis (strain Bpp5) TaxID=1208660 RepID=K0MJP1_BORPB|nr:ABC transporter permease [Bordetella parapertussis]CCJ51115.1 inner membrane component of ABC transporter [Bordetella parapertussis Bpp5]
MNALLSCATQCARQLFSIAAIAFTIFLLVRAAPGDITDYYAARGDYDAAGLTQLRADLGLDHGLAVQFQRWLAHASQGDFGESMRYGSPVAAMLAEAVPHTLRLAAASLAFGLALGVGLAVAAQAFKRLRLDALIEGLNIWSIAVPSFCTGVLGILVFSIWLKWLPIRGQMLLPVIILGLDIAGQIAKPLHEELKQTARAGFVRTARAKGLSSWRIIWRHVLPNCLSQVIALSGVILGGLVGGALTMEALFAQPGLGGLTLEAIRSRDYPVIQVAVMALATFVILVNIAAAALQRWADPRLARRAA